MRMAMIGKSILRVIDLEDAFMEGKNLEETVDQYNHQPKDQVPD